MLPASLAAATDALPDSVSGSDAHSTIHIVTAQEYPRALANRRVLRHQNCYQRIARPLPLRVLRLITFPFVPTPNQEEST